MKTTRNFAERIVHRNLINLFETQVDSLSYKSCGDVEKKLLTFAISAAESSRESLAGFGRSWKHFEIALH